MKTYHITVIELVETVYEVDATGKKSARKLGEALHIDGACSPHAERLEVNVLERTFYAAKLD